MAREYENCSSRTRSRNGEGTFSQDPVAGSLYVHPLSSTGSPLTTTTFSRTRLRTDSRSRRAVGGVRGARTSRTRSMDTLGTRTGFPSASLRSLSQCTRFHVNRHLQQCRVQRTRELGTRGYTEAGRRLAEFAPAALLFLTPLLATPLHRYLSPIMCA